MGSKVATKSSSSIQLGTVAQDQTLNRHRVASTIKPWLPSTSKQESRLPNNMSNSSNNSNRRPPHHNSKLRHSMCHNSTNSLIQYLYSKSAMIYHSRLSQQIILEISLSHRCRCPASTLNRATTMVRIGNPRRSLLCKQLSNANRRSCRDP